MQIKCYFKSCEVCRLSEQRAWLLIVEYQTSPSYHRGYQTVGLKKPSVEDEGGG